MFGQFNFITACLLSLMLVACSSNSINAPIDSRSNETHPRSSSTVKTSPLKTGRSYSTSGAAYYVVRQGDTLFSISRQHGIDQWQLANINGIASPYTLHKGQRLKLRGKGKTGAVTAPAPKAGKVKSKPAPKVVANKTYKPTAAKSSAVIKFDGKWKWPTRGRLLRGYKPKEAGKKGIYIGGHMGQPVKAAANGKVVYVGSGLIGYGRLIIIRHNDNLLSTYGHNSKLLVEEDEFVKAGRVIAKMGSSGTDHTGLYFEIRRDGKPVNPLTYLPKKH